MSVHLFSSNLATNIHVNQRKEPTLKSDNISKQVHMNKPKYVCIVPEKRAEITTEGGLNLKIKDKFLKRMISRLKNQQEKFLTMKNY